MAKYDWCFDNTTPLVDDKGASQIINARNAYVEKFKDVHDNISETEWNNIISNLNLDEYGITGFENKPTFEELFNLSETASGGLVDALTNYRTTTSIEIKLFETQKDHARRAETLYSKLNELFTAFGEYAQFAADNPGDFKDEIDRSQEIIKLYTEIYNRAIVPPKGTLGITYELLQGDLQLMLTAVTKTDKQMSFATDKTLASKYSEVYSVSKLPDLIIDIEQKLKAFSDVCKEEDSFKEEYLEELSKLLLPAVTDLDARAKDYEARANLATGRQKEFLLEKAAEIRKLIEDKASATASAIEGAFANETIFREQCFMLTNLSKFVEARKTQDELVGLPYSLKNYQTPELKKRLEDSSQLKSYIDSNKPINIQGDPFPFINKLTVNPNQAALFDLREEQISSLTPRIRLFKSEYNKKTKKEEEIEIKFEAHAGNEVLGYLSRKGKGGRGLGVGVKGFTFSYDGTDPFSAKKAISAKLDIYAPSFSDLLRERTGTTKSGKKRKYKYVDLALKTGGNTTANKKKKLSQIDQENLDKLNFRIRVMIEFAASKEVLRTFRNEQLSYSNVLKNAVYDSAMSIYLTPTIHEFDFDDAGGVGFSINYLAYIEDYFSQPNFDIFTKVQSIKKARNEVLAYFKEQDCGSKEGYEKFKQQDLNFIERVNETSLNTIIREMFLSQKIYFLNLNEQMIRHFLRKPFDFEIDLKKQSLKDLEKEATDVMASVLATQNRTVSTDGAEEPAAGKKAKLLASLVAHSENNEKIPFMYLNDIISTVMKLMDESLRRSSEDGVELANADINDYITNVAASLVEPEKLKNIIRSEEDAMDQFFNARRAFQAFKQIRIVLGPANIGLSQNKNVVCTLGDIPISLNYFIDFMSEKLLSKNLSSYPLSKFIKDLINDCVKNFVNDDSCNRVDLGEKLQINSTTVLSYDTKENQYTEDNLSDLIASQMRIKDKNGVKVSTREVLEMDKLNKNIFPLLKISGPREDARTFLEYDKMRNYYIFSASRKYPSNAYIGNRAKDAKNGIFHYILGEDKGMLKTISLDKTNTPGLKELRFEQEGFAGLEQLREVYNANISTFLNVQTFPGTYIYIEPNGFDPTASEDLSRFGIGGYYMIVKTSHTIQPGNAETQINAAWVASKGTYIRSEKDGSEEERKGSEKQKKCSVGFRS